MAKKPASFEYNGTLVKVLDGDTIDCYIDLGFDLKIKKRIRYMGIDTWESRTRDLDEKAKGLLAKARNKELLEAGVFKIVSHGTGKFGRVLGEIFVSPDAVGHEISENVDRSEDGLVSINDILINEGHAYEYGGGKKKDFKAEIAKEKANPEMKKAKFNQPDKAMTAKSQKAIDAVFKMLKKQPKSKKANMGGYMTAKKKMMGGGYSMKRKK